LPVALARRGDRRARPRTAARQAKVGKELLIRSRQPMGNRPLANRTTMHFRIGSMRRSFAPVSQDGKVRAACLTGAAA